MKMEVESFLSPYRVLDLTNEKGFYCGRVLGDLGADVIKIEPPGGDPGRKVGPFYRDIPDPEKSLYWFSYNANKRSMTLNIESNDGKEIFKRLVKESDFVIESFPPGYMENIGLGYNTLSEINPRIVLTSITPFGQNGPWRDYKGSDIALWALSSYMYVVGDKDRSPVQFGFPQSFLNAGLEAAAGTMVAHHHRQLTGEGQWVDVSAHQALIIVNLQNQQYWTLSKIIPKRAGPCVERSAATWTHQRRTWKCKDGFICFIIMAGQTGAPSNIALTEWMDRDGLAPERMKQMDWAKFGPSAEGMTPEDYEQITNALTAFFKIHTKAELYEEGAKKRILAYPCSTIEDLRSDPQLAARDFWTEVKHPELNDTLVYPRPCMLSSETPCQIRRRAPLIGEHNEEIYMGELGFTREELILLKSGGVI